MSLHQLKTEIASLPPLSQAVAQLRKHSLKEIRNQVNSPVPFLQQLKTEQKEQVNLLIQKSRRIITNLEEAQLLQDKLRSYIGYLIELKLTTIQKNPAKAEVITNHLLNDEFMNFKNFLADVKTFQENVQSVQAHYREVAEVVEKNITLEHALIFMELPHWRYLQNLLQIAKGHQRIVRDLGHHFVSLAKKGHYDEDRTNRRVNALFIPISLY